MVGRGILKAQVRSIGVRSVRVRLITTRLRADRTEENDRKTGRGVWKRTMGGKTKYDGKVREAGTRSGKGQGIAGMMKDRGNRKRC